MSLSVDWSNPYASREGRWLRGNLHTHTAPNSLCGTLPPEVVVAQYVEAGYDFLALSDHMSLTAPPAAPLTFLAGLEWNAPAGNQHTGIYTTQPELLPPLSAYTEHDRLLADLAEADALVVLNHPNWQLRPHYRREELRAAGPFDAVEIYNGVIRRLDGYEIATDKWDDLLAAGRRVLGLATDDYHVPVDLRAGWTVVRAEHDPAAILRALQAGNCYASCGVEIADIVLDGSVLAIETRNGQVCQLIGNGGALLAAAEGTHYRFDLADTPSAYHRATIYGPGTAMAWTQPIFGV